MAKYIKREMPDMQGTGEKKCYYRLETNGHLSSEDLIARIARAGSGLSDGAVVHVIKSLTKEMAKAMAEGHSVSIEGLGTFKAAIGVRKDKEMDAIDGEAPKHNATSLQVTGINFKADKELIYETHSHCHLTRGGVRKLFRSPYDKQKRLQLAIGFLNDLAHPYMRIDDYAAMTGLSRSMASRELIEFRENPDSGITFTGRGNNRVYVKTLSSKE